MDTKSLFSLTKYHNGFFKSDKQKAFLLAQCQEAGVYYSEGGKVYNNTYRHAFTMDAQGIVTVEKITSKGSTIVWTRQDEETFKANLSIIMAKKAQEQLSNRLWNISETWTLRAESYKQENIVKAVQAGNPDMNDLQRKSKVYKSLTRKAQELHQKALKIMR